MLSSTGKMHHVFAAQCGTEQLTTEANPAASV